MATFEVLTASNVIGGGSSGSSYLVYTALLTQTGTSAPVATVLENTLGGTVSYTYTTDGTYKAVGSTNGLFPTNRTVVIMGPPYAAGYGIFGAHNEDVTEKEIFILTTLSGVEANEILYLTAIQILVYPA